MNRGDGLASGQKSASFTAADKRMTKEQWEAMFEPEPLHYIKADGTVTEEPNTLDDPPLKETQRI